MARWLPVVAGVWLGLLTASWVMATLDFRTVDRVLGPHGRPEMAGRLALAGTWRTGERRGR